MAVMVSEQQLTFARGMNDTAAPVEYLPDECELLLNGRVSFDGQTVERRGGSEKLHSTTLSSGDTIFGGIEYRKADGTQQLVVFAGDKMMTSVNGGATWVQQASSLTEAYWSLVIMREGAANVLCCSNGGTSSYQWNGTAWAVISNIPNNVKYLAVHGNRLWGTGHSGIDVVASKVGDIDTWSTPDGLTVKAQTHDGDPEITGLFQLGTILLIFKRESTGYIEGYGFNTLEVEAGSRGISRSVGCVAHRTIQAVGDQGVCWLSKRGIEQYQIGGQITLVTRPIQNFMDGINWSALNGSPGLPTALYWPQKHEYICAVPVSTDINDYMVGYRPPSAERPPALMLHQYIATDDDTLYIDDDDGYLGHSTSGDKDQGDTNFGYLRTTPIGGQYMQIESSGYLSFAVAQEGNVSSLFVADLSGAALVATPISCSYDGFVRQMETGNLDNAAPGGSGGATINFKLRTRPFLFKQPLRGKQARVIRVSSQQRDTSTVSVRVNADGADQTTHDLAYPISARPTVKKARVGGKGVALPVEIASADAIKIGSVELAAAVQRDAW
jgi:hypothetical protein